MPIYLSYVPLDVILTSPLLAIGLGLVAAPLVAIRLLAVAILESPRAVMNTLKMVSRTQKVGCLGKAVFYPLCGSLPLLLLAVSPIWGVFAGLYHGYLTAWSAMVSKTPIDFISRPVDDLVLAFSGIAGWVWNMLEGEMEDGFIPCDAYVLAPFGAFAGLLLGMPVLAITLAANSVWPDAMSKALQLISESQRIGPFAKVLLQIIVPLLWLVLLPPAAALSGLVMGVYYGVSTGWRLFAGGVDCVKEMITEPSDLWRSTVLDPVRDKLAEVIKSEQDLEKSGWKPEVQIDVNPLLLTTACAMGLIGGIVTSILYAFQGLWFMFPMAYRLYQTNLKLCKSEFIIVEAIFALVAYLAQVFLIPFYVIVFTLIQPIIGFAMGFGQIAYSVLLYSNKDLTATLAHRYSIRLASPASYQPLGSSSRMCKLDGRRGISRLSSARNDCSRHRRSRYTAGRTR